MAKTHIRFDWAIKKLLRDKANYVVLEGLITELLGQEITIESILEGDAARSWGFHGAYKVRTQVPHTDPKP